MTVYVYTGTVGTGKSLHAASDIRFDLNRRHPRPIIANFDLAPDAPVRQRETFHYVPNHELTPDFLVGFANDYWEGRDGDFREDFIRLYIDEAQLLYNSRLWGEKTRLSMLEFMSQSRKYGYKVMLIAQSAKMIDNQFRMLIEYEVNHRKVSNMGFLGALAGIPFRNRLFSWISYYFQLNERIGSELYIARRKDWQMYDTRKRFEHTSSAFKDSAKAYK